MSLWPEDMRHLYQAQRADAAEARCARLEMALRDCQDLLWSFYSRWENGSCYCPEEEPEIHACSLNATEKGDITMAVAAARSALEEKPCK